MRLHEEAVCVKRNLQESADLFVIRVRLDAGAQHHEVCLNEDFLAQARIAHRDREVIVRPLNDGRRLLVVANEDDTALARPPIEIFPKAVEIISR
jgi:hypothetical protein